MNSSSSTTVWCIAIQLICQGCVACSTQCIFCSPLLHGNVTYQTSFLGSVWRCFEKHVSQHTTGVGRALVPGLQPCEWRSTQPRTCLRRTWTEKQIPIAPCNWQDMGEHSRVSLGWHGRLILFGCRWFAKKLRKLEIYPEYGFRFHRCKAIDSTENLRASHFEPWRKATHKDKDKAPWEDFGSEVLMVFALGQCSSDKHWAMFPVLTGGVKSWQDAMPTRSRNRSLKWAFSTSELGSSLIILSLWWLQVCNVIHFRIFHIAPVRAVQTRWTNSKQKKTHARLFCRLSPITPWCWQEGDDLVFEVVDYDKGAQQGDLMCSCVVPNKATARGDCTKGRKLYHAVW